MASGPLDSKHPKTWPSGSLKSGHGTDPHRRSEPRGQALPRGPYARGRVDLRLQPQDSTASCGDVRTALLISFEECGPLAGPSGGVL